MLTKEQTSKLLNRALTTAETNNYDLYLKIATERLEELLCMTLCGSDDDRTFGTRSGYRTVYVDPFTAVESVTIDGETVDEADYTVKQNDKFNGDWYNIIEFDTKRRGENITVEADWGFDCLPADLQVFLAKLFAQGSIEQTVDTQVKSKKIEDFTVTYKDSSTFDEFVLANSAVVDKYSQCSQGQIRHGAVCRGDYDLRSIYN
jgi:hypothetical protein